MWDSDVCTVNANCKYLKTTVIVLLMLLYQTDYNSKNHKRLHRWKSAHLSFHGKTQTKCLMYVGFVEMHGCFQFYLRFGKALVSRLNEYNSKDLPLPLDMDLKYESK